MPQTKTFPFIRIHDSIDVVAPGFASKPEELISARDFLLKNKLIPHIPTGLLAPHYLHSNDDEKRFHFLRQAILNPGSNVIWCLRGGYGANRLLPMLSKMKKPKQKKLLIGISDITSLHVFFQQQWGWPTLHAPLLDRLGLGKVPLKCERELWKVLRGEISSTEFMLKPMNQMAKAKLNIQASVVGGNLTVLQSTLGTRWQLNTKNKILVVEDLGERGYRVDRILEQFRQCGLFNGCKALVFGEFLGGEEPLIPGQARKVLWPLVQQQWANDLNIPVYKGLQIGHGKIQRPLFFGTKANLKSDPARLIVESAIQGSSK